MDRWPAGVTMPHDMSGNAGTVARGRPITASVPLGGRLAGAEGG